VAQWEPQIRTNLEAKVYQTQLDDLLAKIPGALGAALVNVRFREGCFRLAGARAAEAAEQRSLIALTAGLFGSEEPGRVAGFAEALAGVQPGDSAYLSCAEETLLVSRLADGERVLLLTVSPNLNQGTSNNLRRALTERLDADPKIDLGKLVDESSEVLLGVLLDLRQGTVLAQYERYLGVSVLAIDAGLVGAMRALFSAGGAPAGLRLCQRNGQALEIRRAELVTATRSLHWARIRFDPEHLLVVSADRRVVPGLLSIMMRSSEVETVRVWVDGLLTYGIKSTMSPFPETQTEFLEIVRELRTLDGNDLLGRLDVGGFANYPVGDGDDRQRCQECIYYLPNSRWCDLPELPVPVEAHWWCRLWKM
jgi:hypothetical protein